MAGPRFGVGKTFKNHGRYGSPCFGQEEEEMKLCLMILPVSWYMLNGLEYTEILSHF
jgi:hypothetical protein